MKIIVNDRDSLSSELVKNKLEALGHAVTEDPVKNSALQKIETGNYEVIFMDPAPLNNARPVILAIRRSVRNYPYIVILSQDLSHEEALKAGANQLLKKPLDMKNAETLLKDAERMSKIVDHMGDESEDFPSAGGVIAKSAFNQLFLSMIDRADRYGEKSFLLLIGIENFDEMRTLDGPQAAAYSAAKLSQYLVRLRRQSDIIGQTGQAEFTLMLQRPQYETEPVEAANRFADALGQLKDIVVDEGVKATVNVSLINIPVCEKIVEHRLHFNKDGLIQQ